VAAVGADAGTASPHMLRWVPGLGSEQVAALVARRAETPLATRAELADLDGWDEQTFLQAAGFLRVHGSNPLDVTRIHPERYGDAERLLAHLGYRTDDLATPETAPAVREALSGLPLEEAARTLDMRLPVLQGIVGALQRPDHDPREEHHGPILRRRIRRIEDLAPGEWVKGTVRNVVDFGAFVDIGLKEEGLVHVSEFSRRYVRNPLKFLHVGDVVRARIVKVDTEKHRISLSLVPEKGAKGRGRPKGDRPAAKGRPAPKTAGGRQPAEGRTADDDRPRAAGRPERRAGEGRGSGERRGRGRRPGGPDRRGARTGPPGRGPRGRGRRDEGRRSGPPRVVTSQSEGPAPERPPDAKGRPKIRWAYYDSDTPDEHPGTEYLDEFEEYEEIRPEAEAETAAESGDAEAKPQETPVEEAPAEAASRDEAPAEGALADEAPADEAPAEETPADGAPADEAPADEALTEEAPEEQAPAKEAPAEAASLVPEDDSGIAPAESPEEAVDNDNEDEASEEPT
jgi:predicted RNA-binding protein with RPS1 domain